MKLKEKLAHEYFNNFIMQVQIFGINNPHHDAFIAGFEKARELVSKEFEQCNGWGVIKHEGIKLLGEEEVE